MFPPRVSRKLKILSLAAGAGLWYVTWIVSESESADRAQSKQFQDLFLQSSFLGIKFHQFCIFNLIELLKALASSIMMALIYISHLGYTDTFDEIRAKLSQIISDKQKGSYAEDLRNFSEGELGKLIETGETAKKKNKKFILLMLLGLGGMVAFSKYELVMNHLANQRTSNSST